MSDENLQSRREFLQSTGKWSGAAILAALLGGISNSPEAQAGGWINRRGGWINGGGGGWINANPGGSWINRSGGWLNAGGGGGGWINRRGGGSWINRR